MAAVTARSGERPAPAAGPGGTPVTAVSLGGAGLSGPASGVLSEGAPLTAAAVGKRSEAAPAPGSGGA